MKRKLVFLGMILLLTGCGKVNEPADSEIDVEDVSRIEREKEETQQEIVEKESDSIPQQSEVVEEKTDQDAPDYTYKTFAVNGEEVELTDAEWNKVLTAWADLQKEEPAKPKELGNVWDYGSFTLELDGKEHYIQLVRDRNETYVSLEGGAEYPYTDSMRELFTTYYAGKEVTSGSVVTYENPEEELIGLSMACEEPKNHEEYLNTARAVVKPWLDSLQERTDEYRLPSYTFTDRLAENREFHGDGMVNGGREFVCYVGFETTKEEEDTVFFAEGTYDTFYHYYFGPGILARFRWEGGVCTLTDYDEAFAMLTSDRLKDGLYGISEEESEYKTFYDFMNDTENVSQWLEQEYRSRLCSYRVSHNVMMLANGKVIFMDIGNSSRPEYDGDMVTTDMGQYYYDAEGDEKYSSPVDFIDGQGAVVMTYREGFPVVYDDYNHDGNPDFCLRISSDDKGSTYDVRCMDINGTPWEDDREIYIYGAFEESIRLQVYNGNSILMPIEDGDGRIIFKEQWLFEDKSKATHPDVTDEPLDDYRMYSQKFYLPEGLRLYSAEDEEVICYFWNNTGKDVTLQKEYEIQRKNGEIWESVETGTMEEVTIKGYESGELSFDITGIPSQEMALYRVKTYVGDVPVYGGFYYGMESSGELDITSEEHPDYTLLLSFDVTNIGLSAKYLSEAALYRGEEKLCDVRIDQVERLNGGETKSLAIPDHDVKGGFEVGEYRLEIVAEGEVYECTTQVIPVKAEERYYFPQKVEASREGGVVSLPLTNHIWNQEDAVLESMEGVEVLKDGIWYDSLVGYEEIEEFTDDVVIAFGETYYLELQDGSELLKELQTFYDEMQSGDFGYIDEEEYERILSMSFDEFNREILHIVQPEKGDLCRAAIVCDVDSGSGMEYVYFEMP
ncbi:MAG: hypothetical protein IKK33_04930 [Lachnospiraceae bacterium]|nr:hypothetical protein [Lachnospiraceae bacterium]